MPRKTYKYNERIELGRTPDGKRVRKWVRADSKTDLEARKRELIRSCDDVRNPSGITFGKYAEHWIELFKGNKSIKTQEMYRNALAYFKGIVNIPIKNVAQSDIQSIINANWEHPRTCVIIKQTASQIFKQAERDGIIRHQDITEGLQMPRAVKKEMRFITDEEMNKISNLAYSRSSDRLYVDMLRHTGMRPSEALALRWEDIDLGSGAITVRHAFEYKDQYAPVLKGTKTGAVREIQIKRSFQEELAGADHSCEWVFHVDGKPYTRSMYIKMSHRVLALISTVTELNGMTFYSFRHTYANFLYYHGVKPGIISSKKAAQIMGHSEQVFLSRYTHIDDTKESIRDLVEMLP